MTATCRPLHHTNTVTAGACALLTVGSYADTFRLSFCGSNEINHFLCGTPLLSQLAVFFLLSFNGFFNFPVIFISLFTCITVAHTRSAEGRKKAISICASHLPAVSIFSGTIIVMYLQPNSTHWWTRTREHLCFMGWVIPMLNPLIYSLRNKEVKSALWKILNKPNPQSFSVSRR